MSTLIQKIEKLVALAGNNPNEHERISAALQACKLIRENKIQLRNGASEASVEEREEGLTDAMKEFYQKIVFFNGKPIEIVNRQTVQHCGVCRRWLKTGDIMTWIPKTSYVFHPACFSRLRVRYTR